MFQTGGFPDLGSSFLFCPFLSFLGLFPRFSGIFPICSGMVRGFSRFVLFLFLGLLRAPTRNSPERVRDTIWTFPEKSGNTRVWKHPGFNRLASLKIVIANMRKEPHLTGTSEWGEPNWGYATFGNRANTVSERTVWGRFQTANSVGFWPSPNSGERTQCVPLLLLFVCQSELTEFSESHRNSVTRVFLAGVLLCNSGASATYFLRTCQLHIDCLVIHIPITHASVTKRS